MPAHALAFGFFQPGQFVQVDLRLELLLQDAGVRTGAEKGRRRRRELGVQLLAALHGVAEIVLAVVI